MCKGGPQRTKAEAQSRFFPRPPKQAGCFATKGSLEVGRRQCEGPLQRGRLQCRHQFLREKRPVAARDSALCRGTRLTPAGWIDSCPPDKGEHHVWGEVEVGNKSTTTPPFFPSPSVFFDLHLILRYFGPKAGWGRTRSCVLPVWMGPTGKIKTKPGIFILRSIQKFLFTVL